MKRTISFCAVALLLAGCGGAATSPPATSPGASDSASTTTDPFVGTWRMDHGDRVRWVISESGGRYTIVQGAPADTRYMREGVLTRQANHLSGDVFVTTGAPGRAELSIGKIPTHMSLTVDAPQLSKPFRETLTRMSESTATPTPVP